MEVALQVVTALSVLGSTVMVGMVSAQLGHIRRELHRGLRITVDQDSVGSDSALAGAYSPAGHAIYVYRNARWELEADFSKPGFEPSPPTISGAYEGQALKKQSVARSDA